MACAAVTGAWCRRVGISTTPLPASACEQDAGPRRAHQTRLALLETKREEPRRAVRGSPGRWACRRCPRDACGAMNRERSAADADARRARCWLMYPLGHRDARRKMEASLCRGTRRGDPRHRVLVQRAGHALDVWAIDGDRARLPGWKQTPRPSRIARQPLGPAKRATRAGYAATQWIQSDRQGRVRRYWGRGGRAHAVLAVSGTGLSSVGRQMAGKGRGRPVRGREHRAVAS